LLMTDLGEKIPTDLLQGRFLFVLGERKKSIVVCFAFLVD
jgi:hypothetical protein